MAKKVENHQHLSPKTFNVAVVGLSGSEKEKGCMGVGKSCLCNRFVRPFADDYHTDHISVLSQTDFSGRVVNNDHWLYWGEVTKLVDEGAEVTFSVIEQTEFIDDSCFQPFKTGKTEPYYKRCAATRLCSAEKLMYICKNQLGIEKEYEQKYLNDGRFLVDAFVCVFDVSEVQGRSLDKAIEYTGLILNNLIKTKKPVVLVTTKHDEANEFYLREAEKLVNRKEFRGIVPIVETSAHDNVNVDNAFITCLQLLDRNRRGGLKIVPYYDALRERKAILDIAHDAYQSLIRNQITDYRALWNPAFKKLSQSSEFLHYCDLFGQENAHKSFKRHVKKLKDDYLSRKMQTYLRLLPVVLGEMLPDIDSMGENCDWNSAKIKLRTHPDFDRYFINNLDQPWHELDVESTESRIPFDLLNTHEAEICFREHRASLESEDRRKELKHQFSQLLAETGYVTPGKSFNEVRILFMGRECYESLSEQDLYEIYSEHQRSLTERAKLAFQELLLENSELFYHFAAISPGNAITQNDIFKINEAIKEDIRYKALDRLEQERTLMLLRHLGFIHGPIREHCPTYPDCMDVLIEKFVATQPSRPPPFLRYSQWIPNSDNTNLKIVILGSGGLAEDLSSAIKKINESFEYEKIRYTLDFRIIDGDVDLPEYSFQANDFVPQGLFCVYSNHQTLEYIRDSMEKTLLSNLEADDRLPFHGLPMVILFAADSNINEKDIIFLREEGQNRAKSLQCPFIDITHLMSSSSQSLEEVDDDEETMFDKNSVRSALSALIESIQRRVGLIQIYQSLPEQSMITPDLRILMCLFCGDPYSIEKAVNPFLSHNLCFVTSINSLITDVTFNDGNKLVEFILTSYHGAGAYRDELLHGFILIYSTHRKSSLNTLSAFSNNIPNTPTQIVAVIDNDNPTSASLAASSTPAEVYYSNTDLSTQLIEEGNTLAEKLAVHFITLTSPSAVPKASDFIPFFMEAWDRKPQIEKAFELDETDFFMEQRSPPPPPIPPPIPSRQESYNIPKGSLSTLASLTTSNNTATNTTNTSSTNNEPLDYGQDSEGIYEQLQSDRKSIENDNAPINTYGVRVASDDSEIYSTVFNQDNDHELVKPSQIKNKNLQSASPPPSYISNFSSSRAPLYQQHQRTMYHSGANISSNEGASPSSLFATGRRQSAGLPNERSTFLMHQYHLKKSNSLKTGNLLQPNDNRSRLHDEIEVSDEITDDDDDTVSSGLSGYGAYPPPPEPAPPDLPPPNRLRKAPSLPVSGHILGQKSFDDAGWMEAYDRSQLGDEYLDNEAASQGYLYDPLKGPPPLKPKPLKSKPGKINLKQFDNITDAVGRMNLSSVSDKRMLVKNRGQSAPSESLDLSLEYSKAKDVYQDRHVYPYGVFPGSDGKPHKIRSLARRAKDSSFEKGSDSDSDWSSLERLQRDPYNRSSRKTSSHKKMRKKRGIPVAPPRLPSFEGPNNLPSGGQHSNSTTNIAAAIQGTVATPPRLLGPTSLDVYDPAKLKIDPLACLHAQPEEDFDLSSNDAAIKQLGMVLKSKSASVVNDIERLNKERREKEKKKLREEEKNEKRRLKEEERQRRNAEKKKKKQVKSNSSSSGPVLEEFAQSETNAIPLFVEKCIYFIEEEGLDSEGIYRVPGNRAHVDLLFHKFDEDPNVSIKELDIPVNAVATALKDFFSKRLPQLIPSYLMDELTDVVSRIPDRKERLIALQELIRKLPLANFEILKFVFRHFVKVTENSRLNSMDSKNLAICWWPTLLPFEFNDMLMFERMRPHLEESVQTMIDQFEYIFCNEEERVLII
uniref:Rho-GAP domain-containing protein n=1 Tax=Tetranychus urticae TaxID=32264 RepID=T1KJS5_TETUR